MKIEFLEHTGDVRIKVSAITLSNLFKGCMESLKKTITEDKIKPKIQKKISVTGGDLENLMYNFLEEFLILLDSENFIFSKFKKIKIDLKNFKVNAIMLGDLSEKYNFDSQIKAVTYNEMILKKEKKWICIFTLDV